MTLLVALMQRACFAQPATESHFFLPQNPKAAAYVLSRLSNDELIKAPRGEFVDVALLERAGMPAKIRTEALAELAAIRQTTPVAELLHAMSEVDRKGEESNSLQQDLGAILLQFTGPELAGQSATLKQMSKDGQLSLTRRTAWAAQFVAEPEAAPIWEMAGRDPAQLADLLSAIPLVPNAHQRERFYPHVHELLERNPATPIVEQAIVALGSMPNHLAEACAAAFNRIRGGEETPRLLGAVRQIPFENWPKGGLENVSETVLTYLKSLPTEKRGTPDFSTTFQFESDLASHLPPEKAKSLSKVLRTLGPALITLKAIYEQMRFDKERIVVEAGQPVILTLQNNDAMPHNVAILMPGALKEIGTAAEKMPPIPDSAGRLYVPESPKILQATRLVPPGQSLQLSFKAPEQAGEYPYVCTFPGHWLRMSGTLLVVSDLETYSASHPTSEQPKLTEWKLADFSDDWGHFDQGRNAATGKALFTKLACVQCHRLGEAGYSYGPELTDVFKRYKNDRSQVLQQILEPSLQVEPKFRNQRFEMADGDSVVGIVLKEDAQTVTVQTGPADSLMQILQKADIKGRGEQSSSPMPVGLLNALSKSEILDLLAYLESGGKVTPHEHNHQAQHAAETP